jgi:hypothetical protein
VLIPEQCRQPVALMAPQVDDVAVLTHTSERLRRPKLSRSPTASWRNPRSRIRRSAA